MGNSKENMKCFVECLLPTTQCNLKCEYCYVKQRKDDEQKQIPLDYDVSHIISAFNKHRWGGTVYISLTGYGETFLQKELVSLVHGLLQLGHYVNITTNGTVSARIDELLDFDKNLLKHLHVAFSFHYLELKQRKLLDVFFNNVQKVKSSGASFLVQMNLYDGYLPYLKDIKKVCLERIGALPQLAATRLEGSTTSLHTSLPLAEYKKIGDTFSSPLFDFTMRNFNVKRKEFCYAGKWSFNLKMKNGDLYACYGMGRVQNIFRDINSKIVFEPVGKHCKANFCFNSSHFLSLGVIPEFEAPSYAALRNRDEAGWYNEDAKQFLGRKFIETYPLLSPFKKYFYNLIGYRFTCINFVKKLLNHIKK